MKTIKYLAIVAILLIGSYKAQAQESNADITVTQVINASADKVWDELRKLDNIDQLSSIIAKVEFTGPKGVGGSRVCTAADGQGKFKERILDLDDNARTYTYAVVEGVPAMGMVNNFKVLDLGYKKSMVVWTSNYEKFVNNPQMNEEQFRGFLNQASGEMIQNVALLASNR